VTFQGHFCDLTGVTLCAKLMCNMLVITEQPPC